MHLSLHYQSVILSRSDESSNLSNDSGCDADDMAPGQLPLVRDGDRQSVARVKDNSQESELMDSSVAPRQSCDTESHCSDMSLTDTCESSITVETQEQGGARQYKPRRKYYMYGNLKLVKPIKDVPKRFMDRSCNLLLHNGYMGCILNVVKACPETQLGYSN